MTGTNGAGGAQAGAQPSEGQASSGQAPGLNALAQYTKDLSFENPHAPQSLQPREGGGPSISIQVNVNAKQMAETDFEVELVLEGKATQQGLGAGGSDTLFSFELTYAGVFRAVNVPADQLHPVIMIECPRLLFPFARQIIAEATRGGGFPPLYVDPIDFVGLYQARARELAEGEGAAPNA